jgi:solute carrier family 39 (zinc transporter), member 1/2/3
MQGIMSAISAGMLIYAATVEMIAGDFVMDSMLWRKPARMQALALGSLALGASAMALTDW